MAGAAPGQHQQERGHHQQGAQPLVPGKPSLHTRLSSQSTVQVFQASHLKGVLLDWAGRVANLGCVRRVVVVVSRLVKGRLRSVTPLTLLHQRSSISTSILQPYTLSLPIWVQSSMRLQTSTLRQLV